MIKRLFFTTALCVLSSVVFGQTQIGNDINGEAANDYFGSSVAMSADGNILAVGADGNDGNGSDSGHVRIFQNNAGTWTQIGNDINGETANDLSGFKSIALSSNGNIVAIGGSLNSGNGLYSGHVRVFQNLLGTWTQIGNDINGENSGDYSGDSITLSSDGNILAVGAPYNDGNGADSGHVRVFRNISGTWTQIGSDINGEIANAQIGSSISMSSDGNIIAIGGNYQAGTGAHVKVFQNLGDIWTQIGNNISDFSGNGFGQTISLSSNGNVLAIGAQFGGGSVKVFQNLSNVWTQIGNVINEQNSGDRFSYSLDLSSDGQILAVGAINNDSNGSNSGQVRIYKFISNNWTPIGNGLNGEFAGDLFGSSVSFSSNATIISIGGFYNDGNGGNSGHVRVFDLTAILSTDSFVLENTKIYPNPVKTELHINLEQGLTLQEVNIYSTLGQLIKTEKSNTINTGSLDKGFYFVQIVTEKGKATHKILVE